MRRPLPMWSFTAALALSAAVSHSPGAAAPGRDDLLREARAVRDLAARGESAPLWGRLTDGMRRVVRDSASFVTAGAGMHARLGELDSLLGEEVEERDTLLVLRTRARFRQVPVPTLITVGLTPEGRVGSLSLRPETGPPKEAPSAYLGYQPRTHFQLPFRGEWLCFWGGRTLAENHHAGSKAQRFAYDFVMVRDGRTHTGDGRRLSDYFCYGQPVLAPAAGVVVSVVDSLPDQPIGARDPLNPAGDHVVIDHGNREFSLLAHLQPGSVKVRAGQRVAAGDEIGRTGNSGNTSEPHLHVQLMNGPRGGDPDGLPMPFDAFERDGRFVERAEPVRFQLVRRRTP